MAAGRGGKGGGGLQHKASWLNSSNNMCDIHPQHSTNTRSHTHARHFPCPLSTTAPQPTLGNQAARSPRRRCAHLRALRSATITSADAPSSAAWHQAIQHPLRRAADGILRATAPTAFIMTRRDGTASEAATLFRASFTLGASAPFFSRCLPPLSKCVTSPRAFKGASVYRALLTPPSIHPGNSSCLLCTGRYLFESEVSLMQYTLDDE